MPKGEVCCSSGSIDRYRRFHRSFLNTLVMDDCHRLLLVIVAALRSTFFEQRNTWNEAKQWRGNCRGRKTLFIDTHDDGCDTVNQHFANLILPVETLDVRKYGSLNVMIYKKPPSQFVIKDSSCRQLSSQKLKRGHKSYLTIIPRAQMGSESMAHSAFGRMGHWLRGHEVKSNQLVNNIENKKILAS